MVTPKPVLTVTPVSDITVSLTGNMRRISAVLSIAKCPRQLGLQRKSYLIPARCAVDVVRIARLRGMAPDTTAMGQAQPVDGQLRVEEFAS